MEIIKNWLVGITCASMIIALAEGLSPEGNVKRIGKLAGGLLLIIAILQPVLSLNTNALSSALTEYRSQLDGYSSTLENKNKDVVKSIIAEKSAAYIQDKAASLGATCTVTVECEYGDEEYPYPVSVTVIGTLTKDQKKALQAIISNDFAVSVDHQTYREEVE
jgi:stage III sporulation protein AF